MKVITAVAALGALVGCASSKQPLPTQSNIEPSKYAGTWYEQARLPNRFQNKCAGDVHAQYTVNPDKTIKVVNQCRTTDGKIDKVEGEARLATKTTPPDFSKLEVRFAPKWISWIPAVWGDYWIMKTHGNYEYSLVGTPDRKFLWVLSRDKVGDGRIVSELLNYASTQGFPVEKVVKTKQ